MATLRKILLVDDDDDLREALSEQLVMTEDFDVFEAATGAEGMEKVKAGLYDLVILTWKQDLVHSQKSDTHDYQDVRRHVYRV